MDVEVFLLLANIARHLIGFCARLSRCFVRWHVMQFDTPIRSCFDVLCKCVRLFWLLTDILYTEPLGIYALQMSCFRAGVHRTSHEGRGISPVVYLLPGRNKEEKQECLDYLPSGLCWFAFLKQLLLIWQPCMSSLMESSIKRKRHQLGLR